MKSNLAQQEEDAWNALKEEIRESVENKRREVKEIALMLEQSQIEMNKLTQRNSSITTHLQKVQGQFDSYPRADIRMAYDSALDAQQRLFVMRGQVEKLQSDQNHLIEYIDMMEKALQAFEGGSLSKAVMRGYSTAAHVLEMTVQSQEGERQRLSRQMHDGPAQALSNFILQTEIAMRLFDLDQTKARSELESLKTAATSTFQRVRDFIFELRPMMLDDLGLIPTLKRYVDILKDRSNMDIRLFVTGKERRLESYQEVMIFRAIQELLYNAVRYSQASVVKVTVESSDTSVKVIVDDDGKGFDGDKIAEKSSGMGLKVIRDRVEMVGGSFEIDSIIGQGTRVTFELPSLDRANRD